MTRAEKFWIVFTALLCMLPALSHCETVVFDPTGYATQAGGDYCPDGASVCTEWNQVQTAFAKCLSDGTPFELLIPDYVTATLDSGLVFTRSNSAPVTIRGIGGGTPVLRCPASFIAVDTMGTQRRVNDLTVERLALTTGSHAINLGYGANRVYRGNVFADCKGVAIRDDNPRELRRGVVIEDNTFLRTAYNVFSGIDGGRIVGNRFLRSTFEHNVRLWAARNVEITGNVFADPEGRGHCLTLRPSLYARVPTENVYVARNVFAGAKWICHVGPIDYKQDREIRAAGWTAFGQIVFCNNVFVPSDASAIPLVCHESAKVECYSNVSLPGQAVQPWIFAYREADGSNYRVEEWK